MPGRPDFTKSGRKDRGTRGDRQLLAWGDLKLTIAASGNTAYFIMAPSAYYDLYMTLHTVTCRDAAGNLSESIVYNPVARYGQMFFEREAPMIPGEFAAIRIPQGTAAYGVVYNLDAGSAHDYYVYMLGYYEKVV